LKPNRFRQVLAQGRMPVGHMIMEFGTRGIAHVLESADVDFVVFDMEHSGFDIERVFDLIAWAKACSFAPMVRVPEPRYHFLARVMDAGALGVMIGNVETAEQARQIVSAVKYAPMGRRGVALGTAHTNYLMPDAAAYYEESNASTVVICQIESGTGVGNSAAIAATPGVDCLWVGHYDLSTSMGIPAQFGDERFRNALRTVVASGRQHGKLLGIQPGSWEQAEEWMGLGFNVISWGSDIGVYRTALESAVKRLRETPGLSLRTPAS
jgi:2-dehydro-3-deoxyglucarate aldolase/4-hydroxy-2-oxoheptanedioate aldolase